MNEETAVRFVSDIEAEIQKELDRLYSQTNVPPRARVRIGSRLSCSLVLEKQQSLSGDTLKLEQQRQDTLETRIRLDSCYYDSDNREDGPLSVWHPEGIPEERFVVKKIQGGFNIYDSGGTKLCIDDLAKRIIKPIYDAPGRVA